MTLFERYFLNALRFDAPADQGAAPAAPADAGDVSTDTSSDVTGADTDAGGVANLNTSPLNRYGTKTPLDRTAERQAQQMEAERDRQRSQRKAESAEQPEGQPAEEQPRDEQGKFAAKDPGEEAEPSPDEKASGEESAEALGDADSDDTSASPDADGSAESEGAGEPPAFDVVAEVRKAAPGLSVAKPEDLPEIVSSLQEETETLRPFREAIEALHAKNPALVAFLDDVAGGTSELVAMRTHFPDLARDIEEGDAEYAEWKSKQTEQRVRSEYAQKEQERQQQMQQRWAKDSQAAFTEFQARVAEEYPGLDLERFQQEYLALFSAEHGRRFRGDHFDIIARGLQHEQLVEQAVTEARQAEREKVLQEVRQGAHVPKHKAEDNQAQAEDRERSNLPPNVTGSGAQTGIDPSTLSPGERRRFALANDLLGRGETNRYGTRVSIPGQA